MCGLYTKQTALDWLASQAAVLDCWIEDVSMNPNSDMDLVDCLKDHREWLNKELSILQKPTPATYAKDPKPGPLQASLCSVPATS